MNEEIAAPPKSTLAVPPRYASGITLARCGLSRTRDDMPVCALRETLGDTA